MNVMNLVQTGFKQISIFVAKESPSILTGLGVAGVATSIVMAIKGTTKAIQILEEERHQRITDWAVETGEDESSYPVDPIIKPTEMVELTWKCYIPTLVMGMTTSLCVIGANAINLRRNAALASLYSLTDMALREYQEQVVEKLGKKADEKVHEGIAEKQLREHPINQCEIVRTNKGDTLMYEGLSGRYFTSDVEKVRKAVNDFNRQLLIDSYLTLNDWYDYIDLEHTVIGRRMGWTVDHGFLEIYPTSKLTDDESQSVWVINYKILPHQE